MPVASIAAAATNVARVGWNRAAKLYRQWRQRTRRGMKHARETAKHVKGELHYGTEHGRDAAQHLYAGAVRSSRYWDRVARRVVEPLAREASVRRELRGVAAGGHPIIVGPWLSEVGYEVLYWVPFVRWFADHYRVDPDRLVTVSRGGVSSWYEDVSSRYVELFDLFTPGEFAARLDERRSTGDQKQLSSAPFDDEIVARVRRSLVPDARVLHPSAMFRLLRHYWLGNDSVEHVLEHMRYGGIRPAADVPLPMLPERFAAVKFYTGRALPDVPAHRDALRGLLTRISAQLPIVVLQAGIKLDEHDDYIFGDVPGVLTLGGAMGGTVTPQNNLAVQTEVIRRAQLFVGTCGSLAWLAPMLGTDTLAVYADEHFLSPHLYAARQAYREMHAARFTTVDLHALDSLQRSEGTRVTA